MAAFDIKNKVALITGGASGLGFQYALSLLEKGAKGVTLADINLEVGNKALKEIESKYGDNKAIFVKTDVCCYEDFEGIAASSPVPIYVGTKFAVHGMTLSWGLPAHYNRSKVRVVGVCPGVTMTPLITEIANRNLTPAYEDIRQTSIESKLPTQEPEQIATSVMEIIEKAPSGTMWVVEGAQPPYKYEIPDRFDIPKVHLK